MMLLRSSTSIALSCCLLSSNIDNSSSFSARKASQLIKSSTRRSSLSSTSKTQSFSSSTTALNVVGVGYNDAASDDFLFDNDGAYLMNRAQDCASSDSCSLDDAQMYLDDILRQQKECIGAGVLSTKAAICDIDVMDLVANLREKIEIQQRRRALIKPTVHAVNVVVGIYVVSTILHGLAAVPNVPVDLPLFTDYSLLEEAANANRGVAPILPQEWIWAVRDGYLPKLLTEWMSYGGLVVDTATFDTKAVAITPQEWIWSIQNGSFGHILEENMKYGGFVVDSSFDSTETIPMTFQDALFSIRDGYMGNAVNHFFRNGGL